MVMEIGEENRSDRELGNSIYRIPSSAYSEKLRIHIYAIFLVNFLPWGFIGVWDKA